MNAQEIWSAMVATMDDELRAEFAGDETWILPLIEGVLKAREPAPTPAPVRKAKAKPALALEDPTAGSRRVLDRVASVRPWSKPIIDPPGDSEITVSVATSALYDAVTAIGGVVHLIPDGSKLHVIFSKTSTSDVSGLGAGVGRVCHIERTVPILQGKGDPRYGVAVSYGKAKTIQTGDIKPFIVAAKKAKRPSLSFTFQVSGYEQRKLNIDGAEVFGLKPDVVAFDWTVPTVTVAGDDLKTALSIALSSASSDEGRANLNYIQVAREDDKLLLVSTDGHRLSVFRIPFQGEWEENQRAYLYRTDAETLRRSLVTGEVVSLGVHGATGKEHPDCTLAVVAQEILIGESFAEYYPDWRRVLPDDKDAGMAIPLSRARFKAGLVEVEPYIDGAKTAGICQEKGKIVLRAANVSVGEKAVVIGDDPEDGRKVRGFNIRYLKDMVAVLSDDTVYVHLAKDNYLANLFTSPDRERVVLIMPMRDPSVRLKPDKEAESEPEKEPAPAPVPVPEPPRKPTPEIVDLGPAPVPVPAPVPAPVPVPVPVPEPVVPRVPTRRDTWREEFAVVVERQVARGGSVLDMLREMDYDKLTYVGACSQLLSIYGTPDKERSYSGQAYYRWNGPDIPGMIWWNDLPKWGVFEHAGAGEDLPITNKYNIGKVGYVKLEPRKSVSSADFLAQGQFQDAVKQIKRWADNPQVIYNECLGWTEEKIEKYRKVANLIPHPDERAFWRALGIVDRWIKAARPGWAPGPEFWDDYSALSGVSTWESAIFYPTHDDGESGALFTEKTTLSHVEWWAAAGLNEYRYQGFYFVQGPFDENEKGTEHIVPIEVSGTVHLDEGVDPEHIRGEATLFATVEADIKRWLDDNRHRWQPDWWQGGLELSGKYDPEEERRQRKEAEEKAKRTILNDFPKGTKLPDFGTYGGWFFGFWGEQFAAIFRASKDQIDVQLCGYDYVVQPLVTQEIRNEEGTYEEYYAKLIASREEVRLRDTRIFGNGWGSAYSRAFKPAGPQFRVFVKESYKEIKRTSDDSDYSNAIRHLTNHLDVLSYIEVTHERFRIDGKDRALPMTVWKAIYNNRDRWDPSLPEPWAPIVETLDDESSAYGHAVDRWFAGLRGSRKAGSAPQGFYAVKEEKDSWGARKVHTTGIKFVYPLPRGWKP